MEHRAETEPELIDVLSVAFEDEGEGGDDSSVSLLEPLGNGRDFIQQDDFAIVIEFGSFETQLQTSLQIPLHLNLGTRLTLELSF